MPESMVIHGFVVTRAEGLTEDQRENNRQWVEALRSGEREQGQTWLKFGVEYCCLGVGAEILGANEEEINGSLMPEKFGQCFGLPKSWGFDVHVDPPMIVDGDEEPNPSLTILNDYTELGFLRIADIIAYWAGLEDGDV